MLETKEKGTTRGLQNVSLRPDLNIIIDIYVKVSRPGFKLFILGYSYLKLTFNTIMFLRLKETCAYTQIPRSET